jgi:hypothetical protein
MSSRSAGTLVTRFPGPPRIGHRTGTCAQPLETLLAGLDRPSADLAREAVGWLLPEGADLTHLSQVELQEFLWYQLPLRRLAETSELHAIAWSLADLLAAAGLERYAALCRARQTHRLLDAWQDANHAPAHKMMREAITFSGVDPPDTSLLIWGSVLGVAEQSARRRVSQALEQAVDASELVPGERGWKRLAVGITEVSLTMPMLDLRGGTLLQAVGRERAEAWAAGYPAVRQDLLTQMLPLLAGAVGVPVRASECLTPLRWLLEHIADGVKLTQAGCLPKALVREASDSFGWSDFTGGALRTETDLPELASLNELTRRLRLITKKSRQVSLTAKGRRALGNSSLLWCSVVAEVFSGGTCEGEGAAVAAATLVQARSPVPLSTVQAMVRAGLVGRWPTGEGETHEHRPSFDASRNFGLLAGVFGWIEYDDDGQNRTWMLTSSGRQAALMGLQLQARTPRNCV